MSEPFDGRVTDITRRKTQQHHRHSIKQTVADRVVIMVQKRQDTIYSQTRIHYV